MIQEFKTTRHSLTRVHNRPGKMQQTRIFCSKALLLTQEQERKSAAERGREEERERRRETQRERQREGQRGREAESRGREQRKRRRERDEERRDEEGECQNPVPFKENYPPPRTYYSLIGCSPSAELSSRGRQSTWGGKLPLAHAQIICLPLRTQDVSAILQRRM